MEVRHEVIDGVRVLRLRGELDLHGAESLRLAGREAGEGSGADMVIDLRGVTFIDSSGLGALLGRYRQVTYGGGRVVLVGGPPQVRQVLELAGVTRTIPLYRTEREALGRLQGAGEEDEE